MASLTLKNVPESLLRALRRAADRERRSLNQQAILLLEASVGDAARDPRTEARAQVAAWRRIAGHWQSDVDAETDLRRARAMRSAGREVDL